MDDEEERIAQKCYLDIAKAQLKVDEGLRLKPYLDTANKWTVGYGRNLSDKGLTLEEAELLLENDIAEAEATAKVLFPSFDSLSENRRAVLCNMAFNLGQTRLAGFRRLREAVEAGEWGRAAAEMIDSRWAEQVKERATRLAEQMKKG